MTPEQRKEAKIQKAGGVKVQVKGSSSAWQFGRRLIWVLPGESQVYVGYAHNPDQMGVRMSLKMALEL